MILSVIIIMMSITLKEFFVWQTVYAQNTFQKPQLPEEETIENIQSSLDNNKIDEANIKDVERTQEVKDIQESLDGLKETQLNQQCAKNIPWSVWIDGQCKCKNGMSSDKMECLRNGTDNLGINCDTTQLINGTCSRNINKTLGVRQSDTTPNPTVLLQDIVLSATSFVGTVIMIALIVMGIKYVKWWYDESSTGDLKGNIKKLLIWLLLVIGSYTIIRLIQYVARGY